MGVGFTFIERQIAGDSNFNWFRSKCSADGRIVYVGKYDTGGATGRFYRSLDYGEHWTQLNPTGSDVGFNATTISCSYDGATVVVGSNNGEATPVGKLYVSTDYGASFTEIQPYGATTTGWENVCVSGDGLLILASSSSAARLYTAPSPFTSWTERRPIDDANYVWRPNGLSYDGSVMMVGRASGVSTANNQFLSTNSGANWTDVSKQVGNAGGTGDISRNGQVLIFSTSTTGSSKVYASTNGGSSFSDVTPAVEDVIHRGCIVSQDGMKFLVVTNSHRAWFSYNQGGAWSEIRPAGDADNSWRHCGMSSRGDRIFLPSFTRYYSGVELDPTAAPCGVSMGGGVNIY